MRQVFKSALLAGAAIGLALSTAPATAQDFGALITFGDSLADSGNIPGLTGGANFPPAPYVGNRFSNGPVVPEYLTGLIDIAPGANRAVGGAFTGKIGPIGNSNAVRPGLQGLANTDVVAQVDSFLQGGGRVGADDVIYIWGAGPNDYFAALSQLATTPPSQVPGVITQTVGNAQANILTATNKLAAAGARNFVLGTLPDFARTPQFANQGPVTTAAGAFSTAHNQALVGTANTLSQRGNVTLVDYASLFDAVQANPAAFGFANVTDQCIQSACALSPQSAQNQFLFFDGVHPTTAAHQLLAAATADAIEAPYQTAALAEAEEVAARAFGRDLLGQAGASFMAQEFRSADLADIAAPIDASVAQYGAIELSGGYDRIDFDRSAEMAAAGFDLESNRFSLTAAYATNGFRIGVSGSYEDGDVQSGRTDADMRAYRGGVFAGLVHGFSPFVNLYASAALHTGYVDYDLSRDTRIAGQRAQGDTDGWSIGLDAEVRVTQRLLDSVEIGPIARLGLLNTGLDGFTETGA
ncbi:MAG: SGNH/GDSL hydrolase family protein, partial [Pseudomonadota bacterium]